VSDFKKYRRLSACVLEPGIQFDHGVWSMKFKIERWNRSRQCILLLQGIFNSVVVEYFYRQRSSSNNVLKYVVEHLRIPRAIPWDKISATEEASGSLPKPFDAFDFENERPRWTSTNFSNLSDAATSSSTRVTDDEVLGLCYIIIKCCDKLSARNLPQDRVNHLDMWIQYAVAKLYDVSITDLLDFFLFNASQIGEEKLTGKSGKTEKVVQFYVGKQWIEEDVAVLHLGRPIEKPLAGNKRLKREDDDEDFHMKKDPRMK